MKTTAATVAKAQSYVACLLAALPAFRAAVAAFKFVAALAVTKRIRVAKRHCLAHSLSAAPSQPI